MAKDMDIRFERGFTLADALDIIYRDDIDGDIFIEPPEPNVDSDEDSADEDDGGLVDNLTSRQLRAHAEIRLPNNDRIGVDYDEQNDVPISTDPDLNLGSRMQPSSTPVSVPLSQNLQNWLKDRRDQKKKTEPRWEKGADFDIERATLFPEPNYSAYEKMSIVDIFEQFVDEEILEHLANESRRYALFLNCQDPKITVEELRCFIAILFVSGYNDLPSKRHYWDSGDDMNNTAVSRSMRRDRFLQICRFLHCADNTKINVTDKAWKIRPIMNMLNDRCKKNFVPEENLSYDESMVKYYGKHSCKQFIRGKPIRFGYKVWSINTKDGYLVSFDFYQGKSPKSNSDYDVLFGKAASPLVIMLDEFPTEKRELKYSFYMDNLFSNAALFSFLTFRGYSAIGTIRENRVPPGCPLTSKALFIKKDRGQFETAMEKVDGHLYVRWMDNAVVTMISSSCGTQEVGQVKRFSQHQKRNIMIPRPKVIAKYNAFMGGTDQMDQNLGCYRIGIRGKKWYWPIFTWMLDVAMQNSWILYKKSRSEKISQLECKREVASVYLRRYQVLSKGPGRPSASMDSRTGCRISDTIRFDRTDHLVQRTEENKKRRCAGRTCKSIIRTMCGKCNVALCIDCFKLFHTRE